MKITTNSGAGRLWVFLPVVIFICMSGCTRVPSVDVEGSFLPSWMLCILIGSMAAIATHMYILRRRFQKHISPAVVFYPSLAVSAACLVWIMFFR
jgi:hypothetical protein